MNRFVLLRVYRVGTKSIRDKARYVKQGLKKELSLLDLTMLSLGAIIGSGWLFASQRGANLAGPAAIFAWLIGGLAVLFIALVYMELGSMLPESGGLIRYPQFSHGSFVSYIMGFSIIIADSAVVAIESEAVVQYMSTYIKSLYNNNSLTFSGWLLSVILIVVFFILNYKSVKLFAKGNTFITILKFITPALTVLVLLPQFHAVNMTSAGFAPFGLPGILTAVSSGGIVFSFLGFRQAINMAGEAKNPQRDVPLATMLALGLGIVVYVLLQSAYIGALPAANLAKGWGSINFRSPFADLALLLNLNWLASILFADAIISPAGTGNIYLASTSRLIMAHADNGFWWKIFKKIDLNSGIPRPALWLTVILGIVWTAPFPAWNKLVGVVSGAVVLTYMIGPVSALALRRTAPDLKRPLTIKGLPIISVLAYIVGTLLIYWSGWSTVSVVMLVNLCGLVLYAGFLVFRPELRKDNWKNIKAGIWLVFFMLFMLAIGYLGSKQFGGNDTFKYPLDQLIVIAGAVVFFFWGNASAISTKEIENVMVEQNRSNKLSAK